MHVVRPFFLLPQYFHEGIWRMSAKSKTVYLTFDDGPISEVTPWVLDVLKERGVKATFFCVGDNVDKHPEIFQRILREGHRVGNHTQHHLNGFKTDTECYIEDAKSCQERVRGNLFRPPYGRAKKSQLKLLKKDYKIIYWDVLTGDYNQSLSPEQCYKNCINNVRNGSIIVFHDSWKAKTNLYYALPKSLDWLIERGYHFGLF